MSAGETIPQRSPGSLVHGNMLEDGWLQSGCWKCGHRCVPQFVDGELDNRCPRCEIAPSVDAEYEALREAANRKAEFAGTPRNAPCPCGSGKKFKRCHGA